MKDIAADLGVSLMTVSKALRSHSDISEETRNRVLQRARELNYQPNWVARSLVMRRTFLVGLVIPDLMHSFFAEVASGITRKLGPLGYQIVISNSDEDAAAELQQLELLASRNVDGLILASASTTGRKGVLETLRMREVPFVLIDRMPQGVNANYVGSRDEEIGQIATAHLIEQGASRIGHIRGPNTPNSQGRLRGFRKALAAAGLEPNEEYIVGGVRDDNGGYEAMRQLLALPNPPDAIFGYNDPVAAGAIKAILEAGLRVPEDIAVIGAGNVHYSDLLRVPLSTIDQSSALIGETAAGLLVELMEAKKPAEPKRILVPPKLVVRESSRRLG